MAIKGYWRMNGNSNDASGNGNNGTDTNITYSQANGRLNQGAGFNGSTSQIYSQSSNFDFYGSTPFTMGLFIKIISYGTSVNTQKDPMMIQDGATGSTYDKGFQTRNNLYALNTRGFSFYAYDGATKFAVIPESIMVVGVWHRVVGVFDGTYLKIYRNGVFYTQTACSGTYNHTNPRLVFSHKDTTDFATVMFDGSVDEAFIDNTAWSPAQIKNDTARIKGFF